MDLGLRDFCLMECGVWPEFVRQGATSLPEAVPRAAASNLKSSVRDGLASLCARRLRSPPGWIGVFCKLMTIGRQLELTLLPHRYAIFRLPPDEEPSLDLLKLRDCAAFVSITRTYEDVSGVCEESSLPANFTAQRGRRLLRVKGPLDFALTGVLASLTGPLAKAGVSVFSISTYDTDYLLLAEHDLERGIAALERVGHTVHRSQTE